VPARGAGQTRVMPGVAASMTPNDEPGREHGGQAAEPGAGQNGGD
jgi:hypothetical protein